MKIDFTFCHTFRVRFSEVDMHGHVFNAVYYTYFDTAISEYCRFLGLDEMIKIDNARSVFHVIKTAASYHYPIYFDDLIDIYVKISKIGVTSLTFSLEIYRPMEARLLTCGEVVWVNTDGRTRTKMPISQQIKDIIIASHTEKQ